MRLRFAPGSLILIPIMVLAFSGCDTTHPLFFGSAADSGEGRDGRVTEPGGDGTRSVGEDRVANSPANTTESAALEATAIPNGIARIHGNYYLIRNGKGTLIDQKQRFSEGLYFERGGRITLQDGSIVKLREREMVTFSGERRDAPPNIRLPRLLPEEGGRNSVR